MHSPVSPATHSAEASYLPLVKSTVASSSTISSTLTTSIVAPSSVLQNDYARVQALASQHPACAAFDAAWIASWLAAFDPPGAFFLCAYEGGRVVGVAAFRRLTEAWHGSQRRIVQSLTNIETCRFDFLSEGRLDVVEHLWRGLCASGQGDVIRLDHIPQISPTLAAGLTVARQQGWRVVVEPIFLTPWRTLS